MTGLKKIYFQNGEHKMTRPAKPFFFRKCQFARDSHVLQTETANGRNSTMQPPTKWNAVYLQQI